MSDPKLGTAVQKLVTAFVALEQAHADIVELAARRAQRRWTAAEHDRYLSLLRSQNRALRRYAAAQRVFDATRHRAVQADTV